MKTLLLLIVICISSKIDSQNKNDYIRYYNLCNEGDEQSHLGNYSLALNKYDLAFTFVHYLHVKRLNKAAHISIKAGENSKAVSYIRKALINGLDSAVLDYYISKPLKKYPPILLLKDSAQYFHQIYLNRINKQYALEADSLCYIDQCIIRKNCEQKGKYYFNKDSIPENRFDLDSLVFEHLLYLTKKYGFPSEENIGREGYNNIWVIFHHNVRLPKNYKYMDMMSEAVKNGQFEPEHYAWMYDQGKMNKNEKPFFYYGVAETSALTESEKAEIDVRRASFGIKPLRAFEITKTKTSLGQRILW